MADNLSDAVSALNRGALIVFPTETLYGLGADALNFTAVEKVFQLKGRDATNPFPVIVSDRAMLDWLVTETFSARGKINGPFLALARSPWCYRRAPIFRRSL
jgi:tRNA A37 threonylcarbamoyladenosine synthetase subunit TsaC/SUA5/YrdC